MVRRSVCLSRGGGVESGGELLLPQQLEALLPAVPLSAPASLLGEGQGLGRGAARGEGRLLPPLHGLQVHLLQMLLGAAAQDSVPLGLHLGRGGGLRPTRAISARASFEVIFSRIY